ncbi:DUF3870 domain-containing protein [Caldinitratiruptor microaerophilus]|uniref:DUF3870 domain-containing protein n=1 Tax=Caldinitratiruptor microaerophilus TaxID=671077 RepID=A0AA35CJW1_9FIRM|nr:DUF3870 domain-containing protein [Caldinitratiruptor microaerophilus]BDG59829.1 hypothetical protein caldi_09190 [Caldinitratiruptor microaerophilus]
MGPSGKTVLVTGYAKAPQGTSMYEQYKYAGIVLEVETATHRVVDVEFTFVTQLARDFVRRLIVGYSLLDEVDEIVAVLNERYLAPSREAVVVALRAAAQRYQEHVKSRR